jgi:hypothetical protein
MNEEIVTFTFKNTASAHAFYLWWVNGGREKFEDDSGALAAEVPDFNPNHQIVQGPNGQEITIASE